MDTVKRMIAADCHSQLSILYVEDDPIDIQLLKAASDRVPGLDYQIEAVSTLKEAEDLLKERAVKQLPFDVILLDLSLPDATGLASIGYLNRFNYETPIVVLTGTDDAQVASTALHKGAQDYLVKGSYSPEVLNKTLRHAVRRLQHQRQLRTLAHQDSLTQLPNRQFFNSYLEMTLTRAKRCRGNLALLFIDFDHFKHINDAFGHRAGDVFLQEIATRLKDNIRSGDFVARLGGDEFVMLIEQSEQEAGRVVHMLEKLRDLFSTPVAIAGIGHSVQSTCSIGVVECPWTADVDAQELQHQADVAMYRAKKKGGGCYQFYDKQLEEAAQRRSLMIRRLNSALDEREFRLFYQPVVDAATGGTIGVEGLLRWQWDNERLFPPGEFVPLLEETHKIIEVGQWVLEQACRDYPVLIAGGVLPEGGRISVNVSPLQFLRGNLVDIVQSVLRNSAVPPACLQLEITESMQAVRPKQMIAILEQLKRLGVRLAIDDFGTGYSSMNQLKDMPFDTIKIDRSFVLAYLDKESDRLIVDAMIGLSKNLGKEVVAEGVETEAVAQALNAAGCDRLQGYLFSRPEPIARLTAVATQALV